MWFSDVLYRTWMPCVPGDENSHSFSRRLYGHDSGWTSSPIRMCSANLIRAFSILSRAMRRLHINNINRVWALWDSTHEHYPTNVYPHKAPHVLGWGCILDVVSMWPNDMVEREDDVLPNMLCIRVLTWREEADLETSSGHNLDWGGHRDELNPE